MTDTEQPDEMDESAENNDNTDIPLRRDCADEPPEDAAMVWQAFVRHDESGQRMGLQLFDNREAAIEHARSEFEFYFGVHVSAEEFEPMGETAWQFTRDGWTARVHKTPIYSAPDEVPAVFRHHPERE